MTLPQTLFPASSAGGAEAVAHVRLPVRAGTHHCFTSSVMGQRGCLLTAAVDNKEHWRPEWEIKMVLTGLKHLLGKKDSCPEGAMQMPLPLAGKPGSGRTARVSHGLQKVARQAARWHA